MLVELVQDEAELVERHGAGLPSQDAQSRLADGAFLVAHVGRLDRQVNRPSPRCLPSRHGRHKTPGVIHRFRRPVEEKPDRTPEAVEFPHPAVEGRAA